jgi:hypothetical protein
MSARRKSNAIGPDGWRDIRNLKAKNSDTLLLSMAYGAMVFGASLGAQWLVYHYFLEIEGSLRWVASTIAGFSTGLLIWKINRIRQKDRAAERARMQIIADVNHHLRNCLQILVYENDARPQLSDTSLAAISRIDWTLKNVLSTLIETNVNTQEANTSPIGGKLSLRHRKEKLSTT